MSLKDIAYDIIKTRIVECDYPPGSFLNEREVIEELGISRTPFREAVNALSRVGLVDLIPHKGIFVTEITLKDVVDLYHIREQLEPFAVRLAMVSIPEEVIEACYNSLLPLPDDSCDDKSSVKQDEDLHQMILKYADNSLLTQMMGVIYDHNHRIRVLSVTRLNVYQLTRQQHFEIIKQMRDGDIDAAAEAMLRHVVSSKDRAIEAILRRKDSFNFKLG